MVVVVVVVVVVTFVVVVVAFVVVVVALVVVALVVGAEVGGLVAGLPLSAVVRAVDNLVVGGALVFATLDFRVVETGLFPAFVVDWIFDCAVVVFCLLAATTAVVVAVADESIVASWFRDKVVIDCGTVGVILDSIFAAAEEVGVVVSCCVRQAVIVVHNTSAKDKRIALFMTFPPSNYSLYFTNKRKKNHSFSGIRQHYTTNNNLVILHMYEFDNPS